MHFKRYAALVLCSITSITYGMNTTYHTTAHSSHESDALYVQVPDEKQQLVSIFLPKTVWQKIIALSSCKNMLRLVNQYLSRLASWSNREALLPHFPLSLAINDTEKIAFELVEKDDLQKTKRLLKYLKKRFKRKVIGLSPITKSSIFHYARSNDMKQLLNGHAMQADGAKRYDAPIVRAACMGDVKEFAKQFEITKDIIDQHDEDSAQAAQAHVSTYDAFIHAAKYGHSDCVKLLLPYYRKTSNAREMALWVANLYGNASCVELLLEKELVNSCGNNKPTLLMIAARFGRTYLVKLLLQHGADQWLKDDEGLCPLDYALHNQHAEIVDLLRQDLIGKGHAELCDTAIHNFQLYTACKDGDKKVIEKALAQSKQITTVPLPKKKTLLHVAAKYGHASLIEMLVNAGIPVDCPDIFGRTPLIYAIAGGHLEVVKLLHTRGANIHHVYATNKVTPIMNAVCKDQLPIAHYLVANGVEICKEIGDGETLLHAVIRVKKGVSVEMIRWLVQQGVPIDHLGGSGQTGQTALSIACLHGRISAAKELIALGANMTLAAQEGIPPLHTACWRGRSRIVQLLSDHGADINQETDNIGKGFKTPLHSAIFGRQHKVVNILLAAGAKVTDDMIALARREKDDEIEQLLHRKMYMTASMPSHLWLPTELWQQVIALCSCKNMLRRTNKYLYTVASWANRESLVSYTPLYISETNLCAMIAEQLEKNNNHLVPLLLKYMSTVLKKNPTAITGGSRTIWHYAKTDAMQKLLSVYGKKPAKFLNANHPLVEAAHAGNPEELNRLLVSIKPLLESPEDSPDKHYAQELISDAACYAALRGKVSCLAILIPHIIPADRPLVLSSAVKSCQIACVELLLKEKFPINVTPEGLTPVLIVAATNGNAYLVELLLKHGADPSIQDKYGQQALGVALTNQHTEIVELLTKRMQELSQDTAILANVLMHACAQGNISVIEQALKDDPKIHTLEIGNSRLLHIAAAKGNTAIIDLLINAGADVNCVDGVGMTPLVYAVLSGELSVVQKLHQNGADLNYLLQNKVSLMNLAAKHLPILHYFVDSGLDVKQLNEDGTNMLHAAIAANIIPGNTASTPDTIGYLVQQGVSVNHQAAGVDNKTPLVFACQLGHLEAVKKLIACGADIELGYSLASACANGHIEIVRYLMGQKAQCNTPLPDPVFKSVIYYAIDGNHYEVVALLLEKGVRITDDLIAFAHARKKYDMEQFLKEKRDEV